MFCFIPVKIFGFIPLQYNIMEPGKRPASNMAPTLLFSRKKPCGIRMALGGAGGDYIPAGVADVLTNILVYHKSLEVGIGLRRVYASLDPDVVLYESKYSFSWCQILPNYSIIPRVLISENKCKARSHTEKKSEETEKEF